MAQPKSSTTPNGMGEDGEVKKFNFSEKSIRSQFIRKVYAILMCQLLVTIVFISVFLFHEPTREWALKTKYLWWISIVVLLVSVIVMACCANVRRRAPMNFIFLGIFTLAMSFMLAVMSSVLKADTVLMAVGITAAVVLSLTLFAFQTKWDFTMMGGFLLCACVILILFGILFPIIPLNKKLNLGYASVGALVFCLYLIYDTQLMMGGNHKFSISPEEYIFAALNLYLDTVNIFLRILAILSGRG